MGKYIAMSTQEVRKHDIISRLADGKINGTEAAKLLGLGIRQIRRLKRKVEKGGIRSLIHASRGKPGNRRIPDEEKEKIAGIISEKYSDFGPTLATEKLEELDGIDRDVTTIRNIMIGKKIWKPKRKREEKHREWRQRKACPGEMLQYDGSYEYWFGNMKTCLLASIDDATGKVCARFDEHEGIVPTFNFWRDYLETYGKPFSVYVDKFSTYSMNHKLAKENPDTLTQFERAMESDLGITVIKANSPQAKGRIERLFRTLQDRLIKELKLRNIKTIGEANKFLAEEFVPKLNAKFMVEARNKTDLHKPLSKAEGNRMDSIFSRQYGRRVNNDFTISYKRSCYQLTKEQPVTVCKGDILTVEERMDGTISFCLRGKNLNHILLPEKPQRVNRGKSAHEWVIPKTAPSITQESQYCPQTHNQEYLKKLTKMSQIGHF
jgi:transposase